MPELLCATASSSTTISSSTGSTMAIGTGVELFSWLITTNASSVETT